jgi:hypothetical protein
MASRSAKYRSIWLYGSSIKKLRFQTLLGPRIVSHPIVGLSPGVVRDPQNKSSTLDMPSGPTTTLLFSPRISYQPPSVLFSPARHPGHYQTNTRHGWRGGEVRCNRVTFKLASGLDPFLTQEENEWRVGGMRTSKARKHIAKKKTPRTRAYCFAAMETARGPCQGSAPPTRDQKPSGRNNDQIIE